MAGYTNVLTLDRIEAKIQGARDTAETVMTRPIVFPQGKASWTYTSDEAIVPETLRSYHASDADNTTVGISTSRLNIEFIADYDTLPWWLDLALKGAILTGVTTGSTPAGYTYTATPTAATDDLAVATFKCGDGAIAYLFDRGVVNTMTIRWNPAVGGDPYFMVSVDIWCRFQGTTTFDSPAALTRHKIPAKGTKVYIDTTTLGSTQATGVIRSGSVTINNNIEEKQFTEDSSVMSADFARGEQMITFDLMREMTADTEFALLRAGTVRKIRIQNTGAAIGTSPATNYLLQIDLPAARYTPSMSPNWQGQNRVQTLSGRGLRNSANTVPITATVVNAISAVTA
jgi:hypothetical protein